MDLFNKNCCDGIYNSLDVHFTSACDNKCKHCIDLEYAGIGLKKPRIYAMYNTIMKNAKKVNEIRREQWEKITHRTRCGSF